MLSVMYPFWMLVISLLQMGSCLVACWIIDSVTASFRSSVMILLIPISSPWWLTISAISEAVYSDSGIGCYEE